MFSINTGQKCQKFTQLLNFICIVREKRFLYLHLTLEYIFIQCIWKFTISGRSSLYEVYLIQHYVIKFVSDLRQVGGFLRVLWFPPPIKLTNNINEILLKVELNAITLTLCVIDQSMICLCYMKKMFLGAASQNPRVSA